jgi:hypothetical protein
MHRLKSNKVISSTPVVDISSRRFMNQFEKNKDTFTSPTNTDSLLNSEYFPKERSSHIMIDYYIF